LRDRKHTRSLTARSVCIAVRVCVCLCASVKGRHRFGCGWVRLRSLSTPLRRDATDWNGPTSRKDRCSNQRSTRGGGNADTRENLLFFCLLLLFCRTPSTNFCFLFVVRACFNAIMTPRFYESFFYYTIPLILLLVECCAPCSYTQ